tara:strand:- start:8872 stop:9165 length:294 start_codon:yes stop_codon:yes gene_type:complete
MNKQELTIRLKQIEDMIFDVMKIKRNLQDEKQSIQRKLADMNFVELEKYKIDASEKIQESQILKNREKYRLKKQISTMTNINNINQLVDKHIGANNE